MWQQFDPATRRIVSGSLIAVGLGLALIGAMAFRLVNLYREAADYPGALLLSADDSYRLLPFPMYRRGVTYRSTAPFDDIYHWYSSGHHLGPEKRAMGACIQMVDSGDSLLIVETDMSVVLCDTPKGRMIFVTRTVTLRVR
jgi:hypothetical protein